MENQNKEFLELEQEFIVMAVPASTVELDIAAKVYTSSKLLDVVRHMDFDEVRDAFKEAKDGYIPGDAIFVLAPTKREKLERLLERYSVEEDE